MLLFVVVVTVEKVELTTFLLEKLSNWPPVEEDLFVMPVVADVSLSD
jgi:hypothetical protein